MAHCFEPGRPMGDEVRRVLAAELRDAVRALRDRGPDGVHTARKALKRVRALLRLARGPLGARWRAEDIRVRDLARELSGARDAQAVLEALARLTAASVPPDPDATAAVDAALVLRRDRFALAETDLAERVRRVADELERAADGCADLRFEGDGFEALVPGFERLLRAARRGWRRAARSDEAEQRHEWRKRVKHVAAAVRLVEQVDGDRARDWRRGLDALAEALGNEHDLAVLDEVLTGDPAGLGGTAAVASVRAAVPAERGRLVRSALDEGRRRLGGRGVRSRVRRLEKRWRRATRSATGR